MTIDSRGSNRGANEASILDALVDAERASMQPEADAQAQTWERVVGTVAMGAPPVLEPTSVAGPAAATASPWLKIVLGVLLGGTVAAIGYGVTAEPEFGPEAKPAAVTRSDAAPPRSPPEAAPAPVVATTAAPPTLDPPPQAPSVPVQQSSKKERTSSSKAAAPPTSDLAEETRLLAQARARLRAGSPKNALAPLSEHQARFPDGQLTEDRMVLRARALCESGDRGSGRKAAAALRKAFPSSSHLPRVDRTCK